VLHVIRPSRGKAVVQALFGEIRAMVWVSDRLGSQRGHAVDWQVCLAHPLRDATYAIGIHHPGGKWRRRSKPSPATLVTISNSDAGSGAKISTSLMTVPHEPELVGYSWNNQKSRGSRGSTETQL
jgi:hypothetical protein